MKQETPPDEGHKRVWVEGVWPEIDAGAHPVKRVMGERFVVEVDLIADGHDLLGGALLYRHEQESAWREVRLAAMVNDRWRASFVLDRLGVWHYALEGWVDHAATWLHVLHVKADAGEQSAADLPVELQVGSLLCAAAAERASASPADAVRLRDASRALARAETPVAERVALALDPGLAEILARWPDRGRATRYGHELRVSVDRPRAQFSSWYEFFPRSCGPDGKHGTLRDAEARLPYVADMGFDVLYLPPIHPIGRSFRKGRNNTLDPGPEDVGSPWAIGAAEGGHKAVHPQLGTLADLRHFVRAAAQHGIEVALDIAFQAAPDHPWVKEHPAWFKHRPDGSIQYAENPPKKYQDIYPIDFESSDWRALWQELLSVFLYWIDQGVKIFRVDNPHTKSLHFWRWCLAEIKAVHPDTIFLSESFTAPKRMYALAKLGFSQSYTYFTWRESAWDLQTYMTELTTRPVVEFFRPNFWPNTPDILPDHLVRSRPRHVLRPPHPGRDADRQLRHLRPRLRADGQSAASPLGRVPRQREVRAQALGHRSSRQPAPAHPAHQPHPPRQPGPARQPAAALPSGREPVDPLLQQAHRGPLEHHPGGGQSRSGRPSGFRRSPRPRRAGPARRSDVPRARPGRRRPLHLARIAQLRRARSVHHAGSCLRDRARLIPRAH